MTRIDPHEFGGKTLAVTLGAGGTLARPPPGEICDRNNLTE